MILFLIICVGICLSKVDTLVPLGVNLGALRDWNRSLQYVNLIKQARQWGSPATPWDGNVTYDPINGWPTTDFGVIIATNNLDMGGRYLFYCEGNADISTIDGLAMYITNKTYHFSTNLLTAIVNVPEGETGIILSFRNTTGPGLKNLMLFQSGYNLTSKLNLTNLMLTHLSRFNLIRFMSWTDTNSNNEINWNETTSIDWPEYTPPKHNPWQTIPLLINAFNKSIDLWINIPYNSSDGYIINLAKLMFNQLNEDRNIYVEYSNELWNFGFPQSISNIHDANSSVHRDGDPYHFNYDNITNIHIWSYRRTAYQIKRISHLFQSVFGDENVGKWKRVRPILAGQAGKPSVLMSGLDYLNTIYGSPSSYLHGIAIAPYFTLGIYKHWTNLTTEQVLNAYNLTIQKFLPAQGWNDQAPIGIHATYAAWYNLTVYAYEGGADDSEACRTCSLEAKINATRHPTMTNLSLTYLNGWYRYGFQTFVWYVAGAGDITISGSWNLLEDMRQETLIDTTSMFNSTSPVKQLPRPAPKLKAIDLICQSTIELDFGISLPTYNFNATNFMNHSIDYPYPYLTNLTLNSTFYYPLKILCSPIEINLIVYLSGDSGLLQISINNYLFIQIKTPQTINSTTFEPTSPITFYLNQTTLPSIATLRFKILQQNYSIRSFDITIN